MLDVDKKKFLMSNGLHREYRADVTTNMRTMGNNWNRDLVSPAKELAIPIIKQVDGRHLLLSTMVNVEETVKQIRNVVSVSVNILASKKSVLGFKL